MNNRLAELETAYLEAGEVTEEPGDGVGVRAGATSGEPADDAAPSGSADTFFKSNPAAGHRSRQAPRNRWTAVRCPTTANSASSRPTTFSPATIGAE